METADHAYNSIFYYIFIFFDLISYKYCWVWCRVWLCVNVVLMFFFFYCMFYWKRAYEFCSYSKNEFELRVFFYVLINLKNSKLFHRTLWFVENYCLNAMVHLRVRNSQEKKNSRTRILRALCRSEVLYRYLQITKNANAVLFYGQRFYL